VRAAVYYAENLDAVKNVVEQLDPEDSVAIAESQEVLNSATLETELIYISAHLAFLPTFIEKLEEKGLTLDKAVHLVEKAQAELDSIPGENSRVLSAKLKRVLENNPGFKLVQQLAAVLDGTCSTLPTGFSPSDAASFKYCPIATADVERSFSIYKNVLSDKRHSLTKENLSKIMITNCYYNVHQEAQ